MRDEKRKRRRIMDNGAQNRRRWRRRDDGSRGRGGREQVGAEHLVRLEAGIPEC